jgi:Tol biopolymer transport system component
VDRTGKRLSAIDVGSTGAHPELSTEGARLVSERQDSTSLVFNLWMFDLNRKVASRLAFGSGGQGPAVWTPDGKSLIFAGTVDGTQGIFMAPADASKRPTPIARGLFHHLHVTPDGKTVAAELGGGFSGHEIDRIAVQGGAEPQPLIKSTTAVIGNPQFSPDGRWFSYSSTESGRRQVYVESFPPGGGRWQVSSGQPSPEASMGGGGNLSRWRADGREIVYYDEASQSIWSVPVTPRGAGLELGTPVKLFDAQFLNGYFAITPDAQRFYANMAPEVPREQGLSADPLTIVLNWRGQAKK